MTIKAGDRLPEVSLQRIRDGVENVDTRALFDNTRVVIFAVPGAFTPTCSEKHVPEGMLMLADGNGEFTRALGLEMDASAYGMGVRSKRYAIYAEDGVARQVLVEAPGEFRVSSAEHVLAQLP